jgi:hypothetical protein
MMYRKNGEGYEVVLTDVAGNIRTIGFVKKYCPDGVRWSAVDMQENGETFSTRKDAGKWLLWRYIENGSQTGSRQSRGRVDLGLDEP